MAWTQNEQMSPIRDEGDKAKGKRGTDSWSDLVDENKSITGQTSNMKPVSFLHQNSLEFDPSNSTYNNTHLDIKLVHRILPPSLPQTLKTLVQKPRSKILDLCF